MIRSISLENFKSWKSVKDMRFAPITGLFGANSSGKTSILQSILLFKQTVDSTDRAQVLNLGDERSPISLGTFKDIIWNHHVNSELFWSVTWDGFRAEMYDPRSHDAKVLFSDDTCTFRCRLQDVEAEWETIFDAIRVAEFTYIFSGAQFTYQYNKQLEAYDLKVDDPKGFDFERRYPGLHGFAEPHRFYGFPTELHKYIKHTEPLSLLEHYIEEYLFRDLYYLGPLRDHPRSGYYLWGGSGGTGVGWRGEKTIDVMIASRLSGSGIEEIIARCLDNLGLIAEMKIQPISVNDKLYQVLVKKTSNSEWVKITDVGFGVSQILPVLVLCHVVKEGSTIILEQPEIHLHPSVQAGLADIFIDVIKNRNIQIMLESHSEHLLRRLQRRIAEERLAKDDVALYFCEYKEDHSELKELDVDEYGNIKNWPKDFFADDMGELAAMTIAEMDRKLKAEGP